MRYPTALTLPLPVPSALKRAGEYWVSMMGKTWEAPSWIVVWPGWTESGIHTLHLPEPAKTTVADTRPPIRTPAPALVPRFVPMMSARQAGERRLSCDAEFTTTTILGVACA